MNDKRTQIYINPLIQKRVGLFTGGLSVMGLIIGVACLGFLPTLINAFSHQRTFVPGQGLDTLLYSLPWIIFLLGLIFSLAVLGGVYFSHRVVGPIQKMENEIVECLKGEKKPVFHLRKGDLMGKFADLLNELIQRQVVIEDAADKLIQEVEQVLGHLDCRKSVNETIQNSQVDTYRLLKQIHAFKSLLHDRDQENIAYSTDSVEKAA